MTRSVHKAVNRFITTLRSTSSINSTSDTGTFEIQDTSISGFTLPTGNCRIYMVAEFGQIAKEEIFRVTNITGNVCTYNLRIPVNGYVKPSHSGGASVRINDVADIINDISNHIDTFGYVERITGTQTVNVEGGNYNGNGTTYAVVNQTFAITGGQLVDNTTNYIYFNLTTNLFTVTQTATLTAAIQMALVVCAGGAITGITDKRPAFFTTYGEIAAKLDKAAGVRDTIGLNKTIVVDRSTGTEVIKNVDDATTLDLTTTLRLRKASGDYSDAPVTLVKNAIDSNLHPLPVVSTMTAPIAVDSFNTQLISSNSAGDTTNRLNPTYVGGGGGTQVSITYVFTANKNLFLNSATSDTDSRTSFTLNLKETVGGAVLYTASGVTGTVDTFGTGIFLRKGVSYTIESNFSKASDYSSTFVGTGDLVVTLLTAIGRRPSSFTLNYTVANNIPFGITTVSNVQTPVSAVGGTIFQIQIALRKIGTPPQVVNVELLNSAGAVITGATATISSGTVTTSQANYNVTLGTPYVATAAEKLFVKVSTTGADNSNYYMIYGSTELSTSGINASTNADANTLFYASVVSTGLNQYIGVPCHPTRSKYSGLCDTTVTNFGLAYLRTSGYSSSVTELNADTTYYVNSDNTGAITTSASSGVSIGRTYAKNFIVKMP